MGMMSIIGTVVVGLVVAVLAHWYYAGAVDIFTTTLLGIAGSILGGFLSGLIWKAPDGNFHPAGWALSIVGAVMLIWVYLNFLK